MKYSVDLTIECQGYIHMIEELRPFGDVLQIGIGHKKAAAAIAAYHPKSHVIIESDPVLIRAVDKTAHALFESGGAFDILLEPWQKVLPTLGVFDIIYCEILELGGLFSELPRIRYSDRDLDGFCEGTAKSAPEQLFRFLHELLHNGQISEEQLSHMVKKYKLHGPVPQLKQSCKQMVACLKECLSSHMRQGSFFGAVLNDLVTAFEDPEFVALVSDPYVELRECKGGLIVEKLSK
jgi:hypothetical protein